MSKSFTHTISPLPTAKELNAMQSKNEASETRALVASLFDANTFVELDRFTQRKFNELAMTEEGNTSEGVLCGYGAMDGRLVFMFAQDASLKKGAMDENHAKKICRLYELALKNGSPVVGIFNSMGADIFEGAACLSAYGNVMHAVAHASGKIPQIALIQGPCIGSSAVIASMFDFTVKMDKADFYVTSPALRKSKEAPTCTKVASTTEEAVFDVKKILSFLPDSSASAMPTEVLTDDLNRALGNVETSGDPLALLSLIADAQNLFPVFESFASELTAAFTVIGGIRCGVLAHNYAENEGRLTADGAKKATAFVSLCDAYHLPLVQLVNTAGYALKEENENANFASELSRLALAYAKSDNAKVSIVLDHAIGAGFTLFASKTMGNDVVYAIDTAEISALPADASVAFAWNDQVTLEKSREELVAEWKQSLASPVAAASLGEVDDIISVSEIRVRICSALLMLSAKGNAQSTRHAVLPL